MIGSLGVLSAQSSGDCVQGISTDPDNPIKANPGDPVFHENTFDWRQPNYPVRQSYCFNVGPEGVQNPFYSTSTMLSAVARGALSDFQPVDGWELVMRDMGYLQRPGQMNYSSAISNGGTFTSPYLMLYNRYRGVLRVFAALPFQVPGQAVLIKLTVNDDVDHLFPGYKNLNGLFSQSQRVAQPLDRETAVQTIASPAAYPSLCKLFFFADFHVAYDPCVCYFKSVLEVNFDWIEYAAFTAVGQDQGVTQDLAAALNSRVDHSQFLASFAAEPAFIAGTSISVDSLKTGTYLHARAWELFTRKMKKEEENGNFELAGALYFLATAAKEGVTVATRGVQAPMVEVSASTAQFGGIGSGAIVTATATVASAKQFTLSKALKVAAPVFDFLSLQFKADERAMMLPMAMESERVLEGLIQKTLLEAMTQRVGVPGSQQAEILPENWTFNLPAYPTYNEALGLVGILGDAVVDYNRRIMDTHAVRIDCNGRRVQRTWRDFRNQYRFDDLKYMFNPAAQVDPENTRVSGALEFRFPPGAQPDQLFNLSELPGSANRYLSPFLPLGDLTGLVVAYEYDGYIRDPDAPGASPDCMAVEPEPKAEIYLRMLIEYEFDAIGTDGNRITQVEELLIPVSLVSRPDAWFPAPADLQTYSQSLDITSPTTFSSSETYFFDDVNISANLSTAPGVEVTIYAGQSINIDPTISISLNINLVLGFPPNWITKELSALTASTFDLTAYCQQGTYKANEPAAPLIAEVKDFWPEKSALLTLSAHPNPTSDRITLRYTLPAEAYVSLTLYDITGRSVMPIQAETLTSAGQQETNADLSSLAAGMYQVILKADGQRQVIKVVKTQ